jgi:hypothetical protein
MSGHWPPEWDDPEEFSGSYDAGDLDAESAAQLAAVAAFLASVPDPVLPRSVEVRISTAIAAEAESRGARSEVSDLSAFSQKPRWRRLGYAKVLAPVAACLVLFAALGGYFASSATDSSSQVTAAGSTVPSPAGTQASVPKAEFGTDAGATGRAGAESGVVPNASASASATSSTPFVITQSGTSYEPARLAAQVLARLPGYALAQRKWSGPQSTAATAAAPAGSSPASGTAAAGSAGTANTPAAYLPSAGLVGCVEHFTHGNPPRLLDRGTYQGTSVYVIVGESKVWVVGLGCTASHPELLASAALTG